MNPYGEQSIRTKPLRARNLKQLISILAPGPRFLESIIDYVSLYVKLINRLETVFKCSSNSSSNAKNSELPFLHKYVHCCKVSLQSYTLDYNQFLREAILQGAGGW